MNKAVTVTVAATEEVCVDVPAEGVHDKPNIFGERKKDYTHSKMASFDMQRVFTLDSAEFC